MIKKFNSPALEALSTFFILLDKVETVGIVPWVKKTVETTLVSTNKSNEIEHELNICQYNPQAREVFVTYLENATVTIYFKNNALNETSRRTFNLGSCVLGGVLNILCIKRFSF